MLKSLKWVILMNRQQLIKQIREKKSFLCIGLDSDIKKILMANKIALQKI